jgi:rod shape determining protein RodA
MKRILSKIHWPLLGVYLLLIVLGAINFASVSDSNWFVSLDVSYQRELIWKLLGLVTLFVILLFDYKVFYSLAWPLYLFSLFMLFLLPFMGSYGGGQKNWLDIFGFRFQPSELMKLALVMVLAHLFKERRSQYQEAKKTIVIALAIIIMPTLALLLVKDIGNSLFFLLIGISMLWSFGLPKKYLVSILLTLVTLFLLAYFFYMSPYQKERIHNFLDPGRDPHRSGYQLIQSRRAIGSGQLLGKGYRQGQIHRLKFLPTKKTDFIFSVWAEEWGFIGNVALLVLFFIFLHFILRVAQSAKEAWGSFLSLGVFLMFFWQIVINLAGVLGLMPLTGVPLPFFSQGGSSYLTLSLALALVFNVYYRNKRESLIV